jgi:hypothetical protein
MLRKLLMETVETVQFSQRSWENPQINSGVNPINFITGTVLTVFLG